MPIALTTTRGVKYADDTATPRQLIAWEHGECAMRSEEIERIPHVRITGGKHGSVELAGRTGALSALTYDLTLERYDRYYNAWIELDEPFVWTTTPGQPTVAKVCVSVENIEYIDAP